MSVLDLSTREITVLCSLNLELNSKEDTAITHAEIDETPRRRSRMEILSSMLEAAINGSKKTRIMYRASLNFKQMQRYLPLLVERGLLENTKLGKATVYKTTRKGLDYLKKYEELTKL